MRSGALLLGLCVGAGAPPPVAPASEASQASTVPVVGEARYRMSAAIRPLLVFWIRAGNVGGARILWRDDRAGRRGLELLIGSDPLRAPRRINRWGWEREDSGPEGSTLVGLMRKTDEDSVEEARSELGREGREGFLFKAIRAEVAQGRVRAENTLWRTPRDYTYRDLHELLALVGTGSEASPRVRESRIGDDVHPGFLFAVSQLIEAAVEAALAPGAARRLLSGRSATFTFNAMLYDLTLKSSEWVEAATYGGRRYERLLRLRFEHLNREKRSRERFLIACGTDGPLARVPVYIEYQPKWWFKAEGVLDDREWFPDGPAPGQAALQR
jgi:hypothetical protein